MGWHGGRVTKGTKFPRPKARDRDLFSSAILFWSVVVAAIVLGSCGGGSTAPAPPPPPTVNSLSTGDVDAVVRAAAASVDAGMVIAVVDRGGKILAVFETPGAPATGTGNFGASVNARELAIALGRTAGFFQQQPGSALFADGAVYQRRAFSSRCRKRSSGRPIWDREHESRMFLEQRRAKLVQTLATKSRRVVSARSL